VEDTDDTVDVFDSFDLLRYDFENAEGNCVWTADMTPELRGAFDFGAGSIDVDDFISPARCASVCLEVFEAGAWRFEPSLLCPAVAEGGGIADLELAAAALISCRGLVGDICPYLVG
jgi:hypothetical protein